MSRKRSYYTPVRANKKKSSSTRGIDKGENCRKSELKVQFAKDSRMYRTDPRKYAEAEQLVRKLNKS